ncbi:unnamed protein product [Dicrocoelium dendriticum]|nr:unnamed protein product [Dicrocoelium dendriticum]CAH8552260.1 unnamed protein product [Dicrocoelium dendriticum]
MTHLCLSHLINKLTITLCFILHQLNFVSSQEENVVHDASAYLPLPSPQRLPLDQQFSARVGMRRGFIGSKELPVIEPPLNQMDRLNRTQLYQPSGQDLDKLCTDASCWNEDSLLDFLLEYYAVQKKRVEMYRDGDADGKSLLEPFILSVNSARMQFMQMACLKMNSFTGEEEFQQGLWQNVEDVHKICPNPCSARVGSPEYLISVDFPSRYSRPCSHPRNFTTYTNRICSLSKKMPTIHRESFQCDCLPDAKWLPQSKICALEMDDPKCDPVGTSYIGFVGVDKDTGGQRKALHMHQVKRCVCKENYYGTLCDKLKDPCFTSVGKALPGNVACNVKEGNICTPFPELGRYVCHCTKYYEKMPLAVFPPGHILDNCLTEKNPCSVKECMHGSCVLADRGTILEEKGKLDRQPFTWIGDTPMILPRCVCNAGWTGSRCEEPLVLNGWTPWSPWTGCEPACQSSVRQKPYTAASELVPINENTPRWGIRQRTRFRDCIGQMSDCRQEMLEHTAEMSLSIEDGESFRQYERRACRPRPCDRHLYLTMGKRAVVRSRIQKQVRETIMQAQTVHLWTVLSFTFIFSIFAFFGAFAAKLHQEKLYEKKTQPNTRPMQLR